MNKTSIINTLEGVAVYLKATRIQISEVEAIKRLLGCAETLENLAAELRNSETDNKDEEQVVKKNG